MTRRLLVIPAAVLLVVTVLPSVVVAQDLPPHEDPANVGSGFDAASLLGYLGMIMNFLAQGDHDDVPERLEQLRYANIPDDLRFIIDRYAELLGALSDDLDAAERSLSRASAILDRGDHAAARVQLQAAGSSLSEAGRGLEDLRQTTDTLARRSGLFGSATGSPLRTAYDQLQSLLTTVDDLWSRYALALEELQVAVQSPGAEVTPVPTPPPGVDVTPLYETTLRFENPEQGYPGLAIHVVGAVMAVDGPNPTAVLLRVSLNGGVIASFDTTAAFEFDVELPETVLLGRHVLGVELLPQGIYEGASAFRRIEIVQATPNLNIRSPALTLLPRSVHVSGEVTSDLGPLRSATVTLKLGDARTVVQTDEQGLFSGSLGLSISHLFLGPQALQVTVNPAEPWHSAISVQTTLFIIDIANLGVLALAVFYVAFVSSMAWRRQRSHRSLAPSGELMPELITPAGTTTTGPSTPVPAWVYIDPDSYRGRIVSAYYHVAEFLGTNLGIPFQPYFTLRDFLAAVGARVSTSFTDLTRMSEHALYATPGPGEEEVQKAETLARAVQGEGV